jgi:zeaxanthin glucosyltransferase
VKIAFIFTAAHGHLSRTSLIAKHYLGKGDQVKYFITGENNTFFQQYDFPFQTLKSRAFGITNEKFDIQDSSKELSWWKQLKTRFRGEHFHTRKKEIEDLMNTYDPEIIFIDEFCSTDFILIYPFLKNRRCIIISTFIPNTTFNLYPPKSRFVFFKNIKDALLDFSMRLAEKLKFLFRDHSGIVQRRFKEQSIPSEFRPSFNFEKLPTFKNVEKWHTQPQEFEFEPPTLPKGQRYFGPLIDLNRKERFSEQYHLFLQLADRNPKAKIIFCSFGTISKNLIDENILMAYYKDLIAIAKRNPTWYILIKTDERFSKQLKPQSFNLMFLDFAPQLDMLKRADVFISHAGDGSCFETIYLKTPTLLYPLTNKWDFNAHASRMVFHGLGIKGNFKNSSEITEQQLKELIGNPKYLQKVTQFGTLLAEKYPPNYLQNMDMP